MLGNQLMTNDQNFDVIQGLGTPPDKGLVQDLAQIHVQAQSYLGLFDQNDLRGDEEWEQIQLILSGLSRYIKIVSDPVLPLPYDQDSFAAFSSLIEESWRVTSQGLLENDIFPTYLLQIEKQFIYSHFTLIRPHNKLLFEVYKLLNATRDSNLTGNLTTIALPLLWREISQNPLDELESVRYEIEVSYAKANLNRYNVKAFLSNLNLDLILPSQDNQ